MRPDNYGTLSALILHLMRSVMITPSNIPPYVQSALRMLHQVRVRERFGIFFVDDLDPDDMERIDINLGMEDGAEIKRDYKIALASMSKPKNNRTRGIQLTEPHRTLDCPWGETISWGTVVRLCKEQPVDFFQRFDFHAMDIGPGPLDLVESLFTSFTRDAWLSLHEGFLPAGVRPQPKDLKSSMETWTCQSILARLGGKCTFLPSTYGLEGAPKSKELDISFEALRSLFFPDSDICFKANTIWSGYSEKSGYIGKYWEILETYKGDLDMVHAIQEGIDKIFQQLQCLPQSKANSNLWHATGGSVCLLTNPLHYRIKSISASIRILPIGPQRPQVSTAELKKRLDPNSSTSKKRKQGRNNKQSIQKKNHRPPPKKRQRIDVSRWPTPARMRNKTVAKTKQSGSESTSLSWGITDKGSEADNSSTTDSSSDSSPE